MVAVMGLGQVVQSGQLGSQQQASSSASVANFGAPSCQTRYLSSDGMYLAVLTMGTRSHR